MENSSNSSTIVPEAQAGEVILEDSPASNNIDQNGKKNKQESPRVHHFFTFNNYDSSIIPILITTFKHLCYMYAFQEETGEKGTRHLQGVISLKKKARWTEFGLNKQIHWEKLKYGVDKTYQYCTKEDTRTGNVYVFNYKIPKAPKLINEENFYEWQKNICNIISQTPDDRKVYWIWSNEGNRGKSSFCKWLVIKKNAVFIDEGKKADIMNILMNEDMDMKNIVVIDVPRDNGNNVSYKSIESIKNGMIFSGKYVGGYKYFDPPHLFVFCNQEPQYEKLSEDRWEVINIDT